MWLVVLGRLQDKGGLGLSVSTGRSQKTCSHDGGAHGYPRPRRGGAVKGERDHGIDAQPDQLLPDGSVGLLSPNPGCDEKPTPALDGHRVTSSRRIQFYPPPDRCGPASATTPPRSGSCRSMVMSS